MNLSGRKKKAVSVFLSSVLVLNTAAMIRFKASSVSPVEASELRNGIIEKAVSYLDSEKNSDGSYGNSNLVNDTTETLSFFFFPFSLLLSLLVIVVFIAVFMLLFLLGEFVFIAANFGL